MIVAQILRVPFQVKFVARLINTALGEEKNRVSAKALPIVVGTLLRNSETVERQGTFGGGKRDEMRVAFGLQEDPALVRRSWEASPRPVRPSCLRPIASIRRSAVAVARRKSPSRSRARRRATKSPAPSRFQTAPKSVNWTNDCVPTRFPPALTGSIDSAVKRTAPLRFAPTISSQFRGTVCSLSTAPPGVNSFSQITFPGSASASIRV